MMQPEGFVDPKGANKVCILQQSILWTGAGVGVQTDGSQVGGLEMCV